MKKFITIFLCFAMLAAIGAQQINSKEGYIKLKWGSSVEDAKKAGYRLTPPSQNEKKQLAALFTENVDTYYITTKDKKVESCTLSYYKGRLFLATETLKTSEQKYLESRYGNFRNRGITKVGDLYTDAVISSDGNIDSLSIMMLPMENGNMLVSLFDWKIYKTISTSGRQLSGQQEETIVEKFGSLAEKLLQPKKNGQKPSYAFLAFSSDNRNSAVENYVTDALTEAVFATGEIRIIERANLEKILAEQKFQSSGLVDESTAKEIGYIVGVDYVCYGTIKDIGDEITVNARVVDVESGEICAMSRDTVAKDEYLRSNERESINNSGSSVGKTESAPKKQVNSLWEVHKNINDFDGYTTYTFILKGMYDDKRIIFGYDKNDLEFKSVVRAGFSWSYVSYGNQLYTEGTYDVKADDGSIVSKEFGYAYWYLDTGWKEGKNDQAMYITYNRGESARALLKLIGNNDFLAVRHRGLVQRFQTAGFWDAVEAQGITREEIEKAIANEEF